MENTLQVNDRVLVNKLVYHFRSIDRGDIVVFSGQNSWGPDAPPPSSDPVVRLLDDVLSDIGLHSSQTFYIKRVIGLPGDHVACCTDGKVTVNGVPLNETSYLYPGDAPSFAVQAVTVPPGTCGSWAITAGTPTTPAYHSGRSRRRRRSRRARSSGRAFLIIWPPSQFGDLPIPVHLPAGRAALGSRPEPPCCSRQGQRQSARGARRRGRRHRWPEQPGRPG